MRIIISCLFVLLILWSCSTPVKKSVPEMQPNQDTLIVLRNDSVTLSISRLGGAIVGFSFNNQQLNPLDWKVLPNDMPENNKKGAPFQGQFLCVGRWGAPTSGEMAAGIPHNGEPSNGWWKIDSLLLPGILKMSVNAPLEQWQVNRRIKLYQNQACFDVEETLTNLLNTGRFTAIVQHATLGGAFLDNNTIISCNASAGFNQSLIKQSLSKFEYQWPNGFVDSLKTKIDLSGSNPQNGYVTTHVVDEKTGWATAASASKKLLIGYVWETADYPWIHIWNGPKDEKLWAKGIEFGTTGLGDTFSPEDRAAITFHGRNNNLFVDAKSAVTKRYTCFLIRIPEDFVKTTFVLSTQSLIKVDYQLKNGTTRTLSINKR